MRTVVIIPAYNEAPTLPILIPSVLKQGITDCIVVDDGSDDNSGSISRSLKAKVISLPQNLGTGRAIQVALRNRQLQSYDYYILMDADGQHDPKSIPRLVQSLRSGVDYVIASRYISHTSPVTSVSRILGTKVISWWMCIWFGFRIFDPTSGFRGFGKRMYADISKNYPTFFSEPMTLVMARERRYTVKELPTEMKKRLHGDSSITPWRALVMMAYIMVVLPFRSIRLLLSRNTAVRSTP